VAAPEERLAALHALDVLDVDAAPGEHGLLVGAEVVADRSHHPDVGEEARRKREVHGRAAEHALALAERSLDRVERDRSNYNQGHEAGQRNGQAPYCGEWP
jgi:hypothetical protein